MAGTVLFDRLQSGGASTLNVPTTKIYELGNYQSVGTVLDIPDLSFAMDSFDVSSEMESVLCGTDFTTDAAGALYQLSSCVPIDVAGQFKKGRLDANKFDAPFSVAAPYLVVESVSYKFGLKADASQTVTLKGDSLFYNPGSTYIESTAGSNAANQSVSLAHLAYPYKGDVATGTRYALSVTLKSGLRLRYGTDYTETVSGAGASKTVAVVVLAAVPTTDSIRIVYSSDSVANYPQSVHALASATRPASIRGRDIQLYLGGTLWTDVQDAAVDFKVTLDKDEEFGNSQVVTSDYDIPVTTGSVTIKPRSASDMMTKLQQITGTASATEAIGALQRVAVPLEIRLLSPDDGSRLKTLYVPDARFTLPGYSGKVQTKMTLVMNFESDSGELYVYKGIRIVVAGAPTSPVGTGASTAVSVAFTAPADNGGATITSYKVYKYIAGVLTGSAVSGASSPINVTGLTNGTAYTFKVSAVNSAGEGALSAASAPVTPA